MADMATSRLSSFHSLIVCGAISVVSASQCPCAKESLCRPISGPPTNPHGELYGFYGTWKNSSILGPGEDVNWTHVTTVAWASLDAVMCLAHEHGARAVIAAPPIDLGALLEQTARKVWIQKALSQVQDTYRDGIVFDYEEPLKVGSAEARAYSLLIAETRDAFHAANPSLQISTCVAWSPDNIDGRGYPYAELAESSDLLYVMDYDTRSQIFDSQCIAGPNAPFPGMVRGIERYLDLGIDPSKLLLGVPWYGYRYPCLPGTAPDAVYCPIKQVPFRGVNCSDAAGSEVEYATIRSVLKSMDPKISGGLRRDSSTGDPYFNAIEVGENGENVVYQYWFDDPVSLRAKYKFARQRGLLGIGPFVFVFLNPIDAADDAIDMWSSFDDFFVQDASTIFT
eukprot:TRINITY_DN40867_c0_g1_i1.p1 TRINITY_DN40867_c0_g1~~TRINITY_DN40867_c0_g1_i1.p1  ORF type:complete len:396 (+),score=30.08 TRINITY_DN40867_c0_g1_i1:66-1253(+)